MPKGELRHDPCPSSLVMRAMLVAVAASFSQLGLGRSFLCCKCLIPLALCLLLRGLSLAHLLPCLVRRDLGLYLLALCILQRLLGFRLLTLQRLFRELHGNGHW